MEVEVLFLDLKVCIANNPGSKITFKRQKLNLILMLIVKSDLSNSLRPACYTILAEYGPSNFEEVMF